MKEWKVTLGGALVMFIAGLAIVLVGKQPRASNKVTWILSNIQPILCNIPSRRTLHRVRWRISNLYTTDLPAREETRI